MFLDYRIYKLEQKISDMEYRHKNVAQAVKDDDLDGQAYLAVRSDEIKKKKARLEKLRAQRYRDKLDSYVSY